MGNKNVELVPNIGLLSMLRNYDVINNTWSINDDFSWDVFPIINRVNTRLLANDLVGIQPMAESLGGIIYADYPMGINYVDRYKRLSIPLNGLNVLSKKNLWFNSSITVHGGERRLRAQWTPEMAQDISVFHNIDAERELVALLSEELANQVDRDIINNLQNLRV